MKKQSGFTLAEATITLIFLSIIAAHAIPAMITSRPSTEKVLFKKAYSTVESTIKNLINDDNLYPISFTNLTCNGITEECTRDFLDETTGSLTDPNTKATYYAYKALVDPSKCTSGTKLVRSFCASLNTTTATCTASSCSFTTTDGMKWVVTQNSNTVSPTCCNSTIGINPLLTIMVDVNGDKEPNTNTGVNVPDQYYINVYYNGKVAVNNLLSDKGITFLKNPTNNKRRSDIEDDRFHKD